MSKSKYYQRPDGLYETSRTINGKRIMFRGKTCKEVDKKILEYHEQKKEGRPFPTIADEWLEAREHEISIATYALYSHGVELAKSEFVQKVGKIKPMDVKRYVSGLERSGYAGRTIQMYLSVIKQILSYAVLAGDIEINPAVEVTPSRNLPYKKRNALTAEQEAAVKAFRGENWLFGYMLLYTGCRRGELLALNWQDIDRKANVIHIVKKLNYTNTSRPILEDKLKSVNSKRDIPLLDPLKAVLPTNRIGKIFANSNGDYLARSQVLKMFAEYRAAVGLDSSITPHCFRHSFATICYEAGIDTKSAAAFLGDTETVTVNIYQELRAEQHATSIDRLNAYFALKAGEQKTSAV